MLVTDTHENTAPAADQNEQGSGTTPDTQEVLKDKSNNIGTLQEISKDLEKVIPSANDYIAPLQEVINTMPEKSREKLEVLTAFDILTVISAGTKKLFASIDIELIKRRLAERLAELEELKSYSAELKPFIEKELKFAQKNHPEIKGITVDDIISDFEYLVFFEYSNEEIEEIQQDLKDDTSPISQNFKLIYKIVDKARKACEKRKQKSLLPQISPIHPNNHLMPNNTLMNYLTQYSLINAGSAELPVLKGRGNTSHVVVGYEEDPNISAFSLTEYERQVSDSIITIWAEAEEQGIPALFTTDTVFRNMPGEGEKPSPQQKGAITKAIEKFRRLHVFVNATDEMRVRGLIGESQEIVFDDMYLSVTGMKCTVKNGGQTVEAYKINSKPIIYQYCKMTNQIITVPRKCIEIKKTKKNQTTGEIIISNLPVAMTPTRQAMTGYIIRRIEVMKRDRKNKKKHQSDIIKFDTLFTDVGLEEQSRDRASENRKFCYQVLDFHTAIKRIKGYEEQKKGRAITGIKILL